MIARLEGFVNLNPFENERLIYKVNAGFLRSVLPLFSSSHEGSVKFYPPLRFAPYMHEYFFCEK